MIRMLAAAILMLPLTACLAGAAIGTAGAVAGTAVHVTGAVVTGAVKTTGAAVGAVTHHNRDKDPDRHD